MPPPLSSLVLRGRVSPSPVPPSPPSLVLPSVGPLMVSPLLFVVSVPEPRLHCRSFRLRARHGLHAGANDSRLAPVGAWRRRRDERRRSARLTSSIHLRSGDPSRTPHWHPLRL